MNDGSNETKTRLLATAALLKGAAVNLQEMAGKKSAADIDFFVNNRDNIQKAGFRLIDMILQAKRTGHSDIDIDFLNNARDSVLSTHTYLADIVNILRTKR